MSTSAPPAATATARSSASTVLPFAGAALLLAAVASVVVYKSSSAMRAIATAQSHHALAAKARWLPLGAFPAWSRPLVDTANYFAWVVVALGLGVLIGALVRAALPARWLSRALAAAGPLGVALGALLGAPLMLCSCCVSPVFDGTYARTGRLGPSLALMLAAPGLNPAALAITFLVFPPGVAAARLVLAASIVFGTSAIVGRRAAVPSGGPEACPIDAPAATWADLARGFAQALAKTAKDTLPVIAIGAFVSALAVQLVPPSHFIASGGAGLFARFAIAAVATLLALPTFGEIPLALALALAGAPTASVLAVLVAGPIINLPSLLVLRRATSTRVALGVGGAVLAVAFLGSEIAARLVH